MDVREILFTKLEFLKILTVELNVIVEFQFIRKFPKFWCQLVRRAIDRRDTGEETKRGKKEFTKKEYLNEENKTKLETLGTLGKETSNSNFNDENK